MLETTRFHLGRVLGERPDWTAENFDEIFAAVLLDAGHTAQLVHPLIAAVGRRTLLLRLIAALDDNRLPWNARAQAAQAAYWVRSWPAAGAFRGDIEDAGIRTPEGIRDYLRRRTEVPEHAVDDLWPRFWQSCATVFVSCADSNARRVLATAFPLEPDTDTRSDGSARSGGDRSVLGGGQPPLAVALDENIERHLGESAVGTGRTADVREDHVGCGGSGGDDFEAGIRCGTGLHEPVMDGVQFVVAGDCGAEVAAPHDVAGEPAVVGIGIARVESVLELFGQGSRLGVGTGLAGRIVQGGAWFHAVHARS
ncbi:hypothetical protein AB0H76_38665 [Nocardia sp. NPDC050712]|uniref:hypothetical protein n=1 Tax=Nocardia sp. NPDC050712 TaxID=3155518 RepID=UPI003411C894